MNIMNVLKGIMLLLITIITIQAAQKTVVHSRV